MEKYMNVMIEVESLIEGGTFQEGARLPSIRQLAERFHVSKSTVIRALQELEKRHIIYAVPKSGYYLIKNEKKQEREQTGIIDFAASAPDPDIFPYRDFQHCINKAIDMYKNDLFIYGTPQGLPSLIRVLQRLLSDYQVFAKERNIFITSGVQQALSLLSLMPFPNGKKKILIEQPGYHLMVEQLEALRLPACGIKRTAEGLDMAEVERLFQTEEIKFFYTMPRFHNPLGSSLTEWQKRELVRLAEAYDVYLVEDDFLGDLEDNQKADPLYAYDLSSRVIYLKSFSKMIFPGLRVGAAVLPDSLAPVFHTYKKLSDIDCSMISQAALEVYIKSGMFKRHKEKIRASYRTRSELLQNALQEYGGFSVKQTSIHTHLVLEKSLSASRVVQRLKAQGVLVEPIESHYLSDFPKENIIKLNVSNVKTGDITRGIKMLTDCL
ncbi:MULTISPECIES: aminotransferase-like domain-containing protein [Bacillus amyloliquefaciens group]|uniref:PLP-dependent aminotransferase family protein n=1 Tax=Bacillus velezensis TaxID=492670 RepID=A0ABC8D185_BACVE|nr:MULTISPECIES: PLP-dependent aminotransferase family protein [Bacillus amyloliquefaciens group]AMQ71577.1 GntR family transcriptional regulator [Bacillus amyloliquefaciens UMAF6639]ANB47146.1 GntR family transcriptional regulator [Bacillus velezensis]ATV00362.1 PLP-dependent aminotransferase family protein [Bacillus velezensis]AVI27233.1 PLP-dependent aminotransferase family protein [Bacillus velezensis]AWX70881.1 PLP-dependent aminotransferase family protein [Bacillus velezensis]